MSVKLRTFVSPLVLFLAAGLLPAAALADSPVVDVGMTITTDAPGDAFVSGAKVTFTPSFTVNSATLDPLDLPEGVWCQWELRWGNDASLRHNAYDETYGMTNLAGEPEAGYCSGWTVSLPYSASAQWQWGFYLYDNGASGIYANTSWEGYPIVRGSNGVGRGHMITSSSLPGVYVTMSTPLVQGTPITVIAHPFGGFRPSDDPDSRASWTSWKSGSDADTHAVRATDTLVYRFTPRLTGNYVASYDEETPTSYVSTSVDPIVHAARAVSISVPRSVHLRTRVTFSARATGLRGAVSYRWRLDGRFIGTGRTGTLLLTRTGRKHLTVVARDTHGHRVTRTVVVTATR